MRKEDILRMIEEEGVEFIRLQFTDIFGNLKNIAVTPTQMDKVFVNRYSFDGSAIFGNEYELDDRLYLYDDDAMDVIHLGSDSSMPLYHVENSVLSFNEKENTLYVCSYDPQLRDLNYYVGVFDQYDTMTLIQTAEEILSRYKPQ